MRLPHDQGGGRPKGFGYAEFENLQSLLSALELNNEVCTFGLFIKAC